MAKQFGRIPEKKMAKLEKAKPKPEDVTKGKLIWVKAPPYHTKEYLYEITSCGGKLIRANLYHCERVRKSWSADEFILLMEMGIIRLVRADEIQALEQPLAAEDEADHKADH